MQIHAERRSLMVAGLSTVAGLTTLYWPGITHARPGQGVALALVERRLRSHYLARDNPAEAERLLNRQWADGSWPDIDYAARSAAVWPPVVHLERLRVIAVAMNLQAHPLHRSHPALVGLHRGLAHWLRVQPRSSNWWFNSIGQQLSLMPILILTTSELEATLQRRLCALLLEPRSVPPNRATGQNLVWLGTQQLVRGVVLGTVQDIDAASARLRAEVAMSTRDGAIQADLSFHQHGPQLYSGGYGLGFLVDNVQIARWLEGTPWTYTPQQIELLAAYTLHGVRPLVRGAWLDWGARGREFTRAQRISRPRALLPAVSGLARLALGPQRNELRAFQAYLESGSDGAPWVGNRHYWRSDFMVHQTASGYMSIKGVSTRTVGTESIGGENLLGYWTALGATYIVRRGDEYEHLPALWDWSRLPGITAPAEVPTFTGWMRHEERFVGGVSDGSSGGFALTVNTRLVQARKTWLLHQDLMVALACGIGSDSRFPVATVLNQRRARGSLFTSDGMFAASAEPALTPGWVWHDGITYRSLDGQALRVSTRTERGDGRMINRELGTRAMQADLFQVEIEHGVGPSDASCAYAIWLGASEAEYAARMPPITVLRNDSRIQAVWIETDGVLWAAFHSEGKLRVDDGTQLQAGAPCLILVHVRKGTWHIRASDPTGLLAELEVVVAITGRPLQRQTISLPQGAAMSGASVVLDPMTISRG